MPNHLESNGKLTDYPQQNNKKEWTLFDLSGKEYNIAKVFNVKYL